jgi:hypothetical protein
VNLELAQMKGILADKRMKALELETKLKGLVLSVRQSFPLFVPVEDIPGDIGAQQAVEFATVQVEYMAILSEVAAIEKALGR